MQPHSASGRPSQTDAQSVHTSSVFGQLDHHKTSNGSRYLQCGIVKDELRVLIPPRPAAIYANLLYLEKVALSKDDAESHRHAQRMRELKQVMVKKCRELAEQRLVLDPHSTTIIAPEDFTSRRLEKWWSETEKGRRIVSGEHTKGQHSNAERFSKSRSYPTPSQGRDPHIRPYAGTPNRRSILKTPANGSKHYIDESPIPTEARDHNGISYTKAMPFDRGPNGTYNNHRRNVSHAATVPMEHMGINALPDSLASPHTASRHSPSQSQIDSSPRSHLKQAQSQSVSVSSYGPYTNGQVISSLDTHHKPLLDSNHLPATYHGTSSPHTYRMKVAEQSAIAPDLSSPVQRLPNTQQTRVSDSHGDRARNYEKSQTYGTYTEQTPNLNPPYSPNDNRQLSSPNQPVIASSTAVQVSQAKPTERLAKHKSLIVSYSASVPSPGVQPPTTDKEHRRRATFGAGELDRNLARPGAYMYQPPSTPSARTRDTNSPGTNDQHDTQDMRQSTEGTTSRLRRISRAFKQGIRTVTSASNSGSTSGSSHSNGSPNSSQGAENSVRSNPRSSPMAIGTYEHRSNTLNVKPTSPKNGRHSPSPQPRRPVLRHVQSVQVGNVNSSPNTDRGNAMYGKSPRSSPLVSQHGDENIHPQLNGSPHSAYPTHGSSPRYDEPIIPDLSEYHSPSSQSQSQRNSRYTSGESSVSEPVIPDISLIMEADLHRGRSHTVRRRLVPFRNSSEEGDGASRYDDPEVASMVEDDEELQRNLEAVGSDFYKRPYRTRDGYGSGYGSDEDGAPSRPSSRPPSRPPSRGILKRSNSVSSQRSNKSVRLEIPHERLALEAVRDAEDKVEDARRRLMELHRQRERRPELGDTELHKANSILSEAQRGVEDKMAAYHAILDTQKPRGPGRDSNSLMYV